MNDVFDVVDFFVFCVSNVVSSNCFNDIFFLFLSC